MLHWTIRILFLLFSVPAFATLQEIPLVQYQDGSVEITSVGVLKDESGTLNIDDINNQRFETQKANFRNSSAVFWLKIRVVNDSDDDSLYLEVRNSNLSKVTFFTSHNGTISNQLDVGRVNGFTSRSYQGSLNFVYPFFVNRKDTATLFVRFSSDTPLFMPLFLSNGMHFAEQGSNEFLRIGIFFGVILIMFLYHVFILFSINKERSDYLYIAYIAIIGLTQLVLNGFANKYFWPNNTWWLINGYNIAGIASGLVTGVYAKVFLRTPTLSPKINQIINLMIVLYLLCIPVHFLVSSFYAFNLINIFAAFGAILIIVAAIDVKRKGYRPAQFFLWAFSVFLLAVIIFVLRSWNIVPYNLFTSNILEIGSGLQITLLSFALADKINIYRREQEEAVKENGRLVWEHNIELEKKVLDRTIELQRANQELQEAQIKLVDNEKMVALGQLTAGIAHEINNPINFVAANIKPLDLDIEELFQVIDQYEKLDTSTDIVPQLKIIESFKQKVDIKFLHNEIRTLLQGIREGASRTAAIVSNLKNFTRIDQSYMKYVNLNEGIESTIILVRNTFPRDMVLKKELGTLPLVECEPGKMNQVFMNIITNGAQSFKGKEFSSTEKKTLTIKTREGEGCVTISIKDNGLGMPEEIKEKIFEPFFTTKEVGEGTGLGMSIVKSIVDSHQGSIRVISTAGLGTEFIISIPLHLKN